jgi:DNA-binding transcriptional MerR regulator
MNDVNEIKKALTIGKLIKELKKSYPDISSSKLRFLESQGLVKPKRSTNKYRVYTTDDIRRIDYILKMQRDFYLPLDVIKKKLQSKEYEDYIREGSELKNLQLDLGNTADDSKQESFIAIDTIKKKLKVTQDFIEDLMDHDLVSYKSDNGKVVISGSDIDIIKMARELSGFGIQGKHLKMFENFAIRHSSFIQQIIMPLMISSKKELHKKGKRIAVKLERELCNLHEMLLKKENRKFLEKK